MEQTCPICGCTDCYFDGEQLVCCDCGYAWGVYCTDSACMD